MKIKDTTALPVLVIADHYHCEQHDNINKYRKSMKRGVINERCRNRLWNCSTKKEYQNIINICIS